MNWKHEANHECILRACSLPVVLPKNSLHMWKAYYLTTLTTATTTTPFTTTTTTTGASWIQGSYHDSVHMAHFIGYQMVFLRMDRHRERVLRTRLPKHRKRINNISGGLPSNLVHGKLILFIHFARIHVRRKTAAQL